MTDSGYSQQDPTDSASDWSQRQFQINQTLSRVRTMVLVEVMAVTGGGGAIASPPTVNVKPLVKIVDGQGNVSSHGIIQNIPVFRLGGGNGAVILDPVKGDIGWMAVADRDISVVKSTKAESQPGSRRKFDMADGVYMGALLSAAPAQYVAFSSAGINIKDVSNNSIQTNNAGISINGVVFNRSSQVAGTLAVTGDVIANPGASQVTLKGHQHSANNTPPTPGH